MNFFETELKKMTAKVSLLKNPKLVGRACIARLTETTTVKATFTTLGVAENYPAIRITVLNRSEGKIDEIVIRFSDHWAGKDTIHAWTYCGESEWYNYRPTTADYTKIAKAITDYLENFAD
jgi:hypothetical protein